MISLSPMGGRILWLPKGYEGRSHLKPHIALEHLLFRVHMQKFGPKSQQLNEVSGFQNFVKLRFQLTLMYKQALLLLG